MICHAVNVDKKKKKHISSLIYFLLDTDYVAFCFQCKYCISFKMASLQYFVSFCISSEMAGCKRPHGLKGSLVLIKVSVNLTFDLPAAHFTRPGCGCSSNLPPPGGGTTSHVRNVLPKLVTFTSAAQPRCISYEIQNHFKKFKFTEITLSSKRIQNT